MKSNNTSKIRSSKKMMKGGLHEQVKENIIGFVKKRIPHNTLWYITETLKLEDSEMSIMTGIKDINNNTLLHLACNRDYDGNDTYDSIKLVNFLIDKGADVNAINLDGLTPLHFTCEKNNFPLTIALLNRGARLNYEDFNDRYPIDIAFCHKDMEIAIELKRRGARYYNFSPKDKKKLDDAYNEKYFEYLSPETRIKLNNEYLKENTLAQCAYNKVPRHVLDSMDPGALDIIRRTSSITKGGKRKTKRNKKSKRKTRKNKK
jgi:hypothetical protein